MQKRNGFISALLLHETVHNINICVMLKNNTFLMFFIYIFLLHKVEYIFLA